MDAKLIELIIINAPNLVGLVVLSSVLYVILQRVMKSQDDRITFLEQTLEDCLKDRLHESAGTD